MRWAGTLFKIDEPSRFPIVGAGNRIVVMSSIAAGNIIDLIHGCWIANYHTGEPNQVKFGTVDYAAVSSEGELVVGGNMEFLPASVVLASITPYFGMSYESDECDGSIAYGDVIRVNRVRKLSGASVQMNASFRSSFRWVI